MVIKEFFSVPILSVIAGSSVAFRSPVVKRFHCISILMIIMIHTENETFNRSFNLCWTLIV